MPLTRSTLPALIPHPCRVLVLGSLPGETSLRRRQYYGHPGNRFWPLMAGLGLAPPPTAPYDERIAGLHARGVGLWDVALAASRVGSADATIRDPIPNPIAEAVARHGIRALAFNGTVARGLFGRFFPGFDAAATLALPSTSGSNVQWWTRRDEWRAILDWLDEPAPSG